MARKWKLHAWSFVGWFLFSGAISALAQQTDGTISGTVTDSTGGVVPGAQVEIVNQGNGFSRTILSNDSGLFSAPRLLAGDYKVSVTAKGFRTAVFSDIPLHVGEQRVLSVVLEIGDLRQTVEVRAERAQLELSSGAVSSLVGTQETTQLPLKGRNFVQLVLLLPGASVSDTTRVDTTGLIAGNDISMSGSSANANAWFVDGVDDMDHGAGVGLLVYPSVDSIAEVKVDRNANGPEFSAAGAQVNVVTKSGTNRLHGSAYEFFRNDKLNAANFFLDAANAKKGELRYNDFGYALGGPIQKDRAFFFWSEEWRREVRGFTRRGTVPTLLERQGNFRGPHSGDWPTPLDPLTGERFPNDTIPPDRLSPAGLALLRLWPMPLNDNTVFNWVAAPPSRIPTSEHHVRVDLNLRPRHTLMLRYTQAYWSSPAPNAGPNDGLWGDEGFPTVDSDWSLPSKLLAARLTSTFGPSLVNQFQFSYSNNRIMVAHGIGKDITADINSKIPEIFPGPEDRAHPALWSAPLPNDPYNALANMAPWKNAHDIFIWRDDLSKVVASHHVKLGGVFGHFIKSEPACVQSCDHTNFWGPTAIPGGAGLGGGWGHPQAPGNGNSVTGNGLADLLLKGAFWGSDEQSTTPHSKPHWQDYEIYAADTWKATPRLTLNYGLRYSFLPATYAADDRIGNFVPSLYDPTLRSAFNNGMIFPPGLALPEKGILGGPSNLRGVRVGRSLVRNHHNNLAPRLGIAWDPTGQGKWAIRAGYGWFYGRSDASNPNFRLASNPPFTVFVTWPQGRPLDSLASPLPIDPNDPTVGLGTGSFAADLDWKTQGSYQWNFTIERQLGGDTELEVSYVGNRGHHLPLNWELNQVPSTDRAEFARRRYDDDPATDQNQLRALSPLKGPSSLMFLSRGANSIYHGLQAQLTKHFSERYSFELAYTWSRLLGLTNIGGDDAPLSDAENRKYDYGPPSFDRTHLLAANFIYRFSDLPKRNALIRALAGGWEVSGIYQHASGSPLTITLNESLAGVRANRPDLVGNPLGPRNADQWFNPDAYALPRELGRLGYSARGSVRAPGIENADLMIGKNFSLPREGLSLQFRAEFFNAFNHTQLVRVDTGYQVSGLGVDFSTNTFGRCNALPGNVFPNCNTNPTFGKPRGARDAREIQLALKLIW